MATMNFRTIVINRMRALGIKPLALAKRCGVAQAVVYDFLRVPTQGAYAGKWRRGTINSGALARIFRGLGLKVVTAGRARKGKRR